jgi:hypothetical protein
METWNIYPQSTPSSAWLCPQNNAPGSDWLHPNNNNNERERNENTALATPTRYVMEYNDVNQNSSSSSYYNPYAQEMERLFENSFLKLGNPEDLLNNNLSSWLNNETVVPVTTTSSTVNNSSIPTTTTSSNSPTPSLVTDDDQDQLYNKSTYIPENQDVILREQQKIVTTTASSSSDSSSPISQKEQKIRYPMTTSSTFYQPSDKQGLFIQDQQYLQAKKHDPKQLLLPLTSNNKDSMDDNTMTVAITSPTSSFEADDDIENDAKSCRQSYYQDFQLNISSTNELPMQQPSPASSDCFSTNSKTPPSSNDTTPKQKKRRVSQRKLNNKSSSKVHDDTLISPVEENYSECSLRIETSTTVMSDGSDEPPSTANIVSASSSELSEMTSKRSLPDDGPDESPEDKRSRLLERNRIAAAKCRQKKKQAQESLQQQASDLTQKNTTMHTLVNDLREEALKLKNQLLAHSTCNCNVIQEYVRTSGQFAFARAPYAK